MRAALVALAAHEHQLHALWTIQSRGSSSSAHQQRAPCTAATPSRKHATCVIMHQARLTILCCAVLTQLTPVQQAMTIAVMYMLSCAQVHLPPQEQLELMQPLSRKASACAVCRCTWTCRQGRCLCFCCFSMVCSGKHLVQASHPCKTAHEVRSMLCIFLALTALRLGHLH